MTPSENKQLVSVLIANYNYGHFIETAIESALAQSHANTEVIVCDDGSQDDSPQIITQYAERFPSRVTAVLKQNGGVASALNAAFEAASGDIICLLDADDFFATNKVELVVEEFARSPGIGLIVNRLVKLASDGQAVGLIPQFAKLDRGWLRDAILSTGGHWSFAPASGLSLRRDCAEQLFPIPESQFRTEADSYLYTQAPLFWAVGAIDSPLTYYRLHSTNVTGTQVIDLPYVNRVMDSIERMNRALDERAVEHGFRRPSISANPVYCEMTLIKDLLERGPKRYSLRDAVRATRAAYRSRSTDRGKALVKVALLTLMIPLPLAWVQKILHTIYLPSSWRTKAAHNRFGGGAAS